VIEVYFREIVTRIFGPITRTRQRNLGPDWSAHMLLIRGVKAELNLVWLREPVGVGRLLDTSRTLAGQRRVELIESSLSAALKA